MTAKNRTRPSYDRVILAFHNLDNVVKIVKIVKTHKFYEKLVQLVSSVISLTKVILGRLRDTGQSRGHWRLITRLCWSGRSSTDHGQEEELGTLTRTKTDLEGMLEHDQGALAMLVFSTTLRAASMTRGAGWGAPPGEYFC